MSRLSLTLLLNLVLIGCESVETHPPDRTGNDKSSKNQIDADKNEQYRKAIRKYLDESASGTGIPAGIPRKSTPVPKDR